MKPSRELRHDDCIARLPEYLRGTLRRADAAAVAAHLERCRHCREYLQLDQSLNRFFSRRRQILEKLHNPARQRQNFERLWRRIETGRAPAEAAQGGAPSRKRRFLHDRIRRPWRSLASLAPALLAAVLVAPVSPPVATTSAPRISPHPAAAPHNRCDRLRVLFIDNLHSADLQHLLGAIHARVVQGPGRGGEYTLRAPRPHKTLYELQLHPAVVRAEAGC